MSLLGILLTVASVIWAKEYYYPQVNASRWDDARHYCQLCFKDLVTITTENAMSIVKNLTTDYWIGLRQSFNGSKPWSKWANGDPFSFQNWYPGHPVLKKNVVPMPTCPTPTTSPTTKQTSSTYSPTFSQDSILDSTTDSTTGSTPDSTTDSTTDSTFDSTTDSTAHSTADSTPTSTSTSTPNILTSVNAKDHCPALTKLLSCLNSSDIIIINPTSTTSSNDHATVSSTNSTSHYTSVPTNLSDVTGYDSYSTSFEDTTSDDFSQPPEFNNTTDSYSTSFEDTTSYNHASQLPEFYNTTINTTNSNSTFLKDTNTTVNMTDSYSSSFVTSIPKSLKTSREVTSSYTVSPKHSITSSSTVLTQASVSLTSNTTSSITSKNVTSAPTKPHNTTVDVTTSLTESSTVTSTSQTIKKQKNTDLEYIEDSCVAMLKFGMWKEMPCYKPLPYICYDELFYGHIEISNNSESGANVSWSEVTGNITHYRIDLKKSGRLNQTHNVTGLGIEYNDLEPGTLYSVQMTPVKCGRDLNPQSVSFYTLPEKIRNLFIVQVETHTVTLRWSEPYGGHNSYLVTVSGKGNKTSNEENYTVQNLYAGLLYCFTVCAVVNNSVYGQSASINSYTKPSPVVNLTSTNDESKKIIASWDSPDYNSSGYRYHVIVKENGISNYTDNRTIILTDLKPGTKYTLSVSALVNGSVEGEAINISAYTTPSAVTDLKLESTNSSITATWQKPEGDYNLFKVDIYNSANKIIPYDTKKTNSSNCTFNSLNAAEQYNVSVITYLENNVWVSIPVNASIFTRPVPPEAVSVTFKNTTAVQLMWRVSAQSAQVIDTTFRVDYSSPFWGTNGTLNVTGKDQIIIPDLQSGSKYYFNVRILAGGLESRPVFTNETTVAKNRTLTLSVLCSANSQDCMSNNTKFQVLKTMKHHIGNYFSQDIVWTLEWMQP